MMIGQRGERGRPMLLVVDDVSIVRKSIRRVAERQGFSVTEAGSGEEALEYLATGEFACAFIDHVLPGKLGLDVLKEAVTVSPTTDFVLFTGEGDAEVGFEAHQLGADYTTKPVAPDWILGALRRSLTTRRLREENAKLRSDATESPVDRILLGGSQVMGEVRRTVRTYAGMPTQHVMVLGESGTGKELCARALNAESSHRGRFIAVNCGGFPPGLAESQLFGHDAGSYTGATGAHAGFFEAADNGILFLDEIGELPLMVQVKLLRVLESGTFTRLGSTKERTFNGRVVAATNQPLEDMIAQKTFRPELRYRFGFTIQLPALRDHLEDVPLLAMRFLADHCAKTERTVRSISPAAMHCLQAYDWRLNNVRELRNTLAQAVAHTTSDQIEVDVLPARVRQAGGRTPWSSSLPAPRRTHAPPGPSAAPKPTPGGPVLPEELLSMTYAEAKDTARDIFVKWYLMRRLVDARGNVTAAAEAAGVKRPNFHRLMKQHFSASDLDKVKTLGERENPPTDSEIAELVAGKG